MEFSEAIDGYRSDRYYVAHKLDTLIGALHEFDEKGIFEDNIETVRELIPEYLENYLSPISLSEGSIQYNGDRKQVVDILVKIEDIIIDIQRSNGILTFANSTMLKVEHKEAFFSVEHAETIYDQDYNVIKTAYNHLFNLINNVVEEKPQVFDDVVSMGENDTDATGLNHGQRAFDTIDETFLQKLIRKIMSIFK